MEREEGGKGGSGGPSIRTGRERDGKLRLESVLAGHCPLLFSLSLAELFFSPILDQFYF